MDYDSKLNKKSVFSILSTLIDVLFNFNRIGILQKTSLKVEILYLFVQKKCLIKFYYRKMYDTLYLNKKCQIFFIFYYFNQVSKEKILNIDSLH